PNRHPYGLRKCLEDGFYLMMLILALAFDIEIATRPIGKGLEEMKEHLRGHLADLLAPELGIPYQPVASAKIDQHLRIRLIHRQGKPIPLHPAFIRQRLRKSFAERNTRIFDRMMLVDMQIPVDF